MAIMNRRYLDIILGIFVLVGLILLGTFIFLIGKERRLFDDAVYVNAYYPNVAGLSLGADVMLAGVVVGRVSQISFPPLTRELPESERNIKVVFRVSSDMLEWIREDSVAQIDSKGLLGDKTINISMGSPASPAIENGGVLRSTPPMDFNEALGKAQSVLANITDSISHAKKFLEGFTSKGGDVALAKTVSALQKVVEEVHEGKGIVHKLIYDEKSGKNFDQLVSSLNSTSQSVKKVMTEIQSGDGVLHNLIYDKKGSKIVKLAEGILEDIQAVVEEVRTGDGMMHGLVYNSKDGDMISNLNEASADLKSLIAAVKSGQGTLGRFLVDPSIYEDLKLILGRVKRNEVLKSLIRFSLPKEKAISTDVPVIIEQP